MACGDILEFQDYLKKSRDIDDKLIYTLNVSLPTDSFIVSRGVDPTSTCKDLYSKLDDSYERRASSIHNCISELTDSIQQLKSAQNHCDLSAEKMKQLKHETTKVRLLRNELDVEQVIKQRSLKLFYEKCRSFYKPPVAAAVAATSAVSSRKSASESESTSSSPSLDRLSIVTNATSSSSPL